MLKISVFFSLLFSAVFAVKRYRKTVRCHEHRHKRITDRNCNWKGNSSYCRCSWYGQRGVAKDRRRSGTNAIVPSFRGNDGKQQLRRKKNPDLVGNSTRTSSRGW